MKKVIAMIRNSVGNAPNARLTANRSMIRQMPPRRSSRLKKKGCSRVLARAAPLFIQPSLACDGQVPAQLVAQDVVDPALHPVGHQIVVGVVVDRDDRQVVEEDLLG